MTGSSPLARDHWVTEGQASTWLPLVYLVVPFIQLIFDPYAGIADWLLAAGLIATFLPLYVAAVRRPDRARLWCTLMALLGVSATPFNVGASIMFVYAAACAGRTGSRREALRWLVGLTAALGVTAVVSFVPMPWRLWGLLPSLVFLWIIGLIQMESTERSRATAELRLHNSRVQHLATVAERERIARDLHDLLGHSLTAVVVRAQLVQQLVDDPERVRAEAASIEHTAREALTQVRATLTEMRQAGLEDELAAAQETLSSMGVELTVHWEEDLVLVGSVEHALALALREAVTNVARHARARTCHVSIAARGDKLQVVVADDGIGGHARDGSGLTGMRERITAVGGTVQRTTDAGTIVTIIVPLEVATG